MHLELVQACKHISTEGSYKAKITVYAILYVHYEEVILACYKHFMFTQSKFVPSVHGGTFRPKVSCLYWLV